MKDTITYQIDFGNHVRCIIKITDNKIEVVSAIDGFGDDISLTQVETIELP